LGKVEPIFTMDDVIASKSNDSNMERIMRESPVKGTGANDVGDNDMRQRNSESEFSHRNSQEMMNHRQNMMAMVQQPQGDMMND
jgi:hypothetical protein